MYLFCCWASVWPTEDDMFSEESSSEHAVLCGNTDGKRIDEWKWKNIFFHRWGFTFFWPLVLTVGMFYRKLTWEAWSGWGFLQKCSWRPVWVCSPPILRTRKTNNWLNSVGLVSSLIVLFVSVSTGKSLHPERLSELWGVLPDSLRGRKLLSWFFLDAVAAINRQRKCILYWRRSVKAPIWGQNILAFKNDTKRMAKWTVTA